VVFPKIRRKKENKSRKVKAGNSKLLRELLSKTDNSKDQKGIIFGLISFSNRHFFLFLQGRQTSWWRRLYFSVNLNKVPKSKGSILRTGSTVLNSVSSSLPEV